MNKIIKNFFKISLVILSSIAMVNDARATYPEIFGTGSVETMRLSTYKRSLRENIFPVIFATNSPSDFSSFTTALTSEFTQAAYTTLTTTHANSPVRKTTESGNINFRNPETGITIALVQGAINSLYEMITTRKPQGPNIFAYFSREENQRAFLTTVCTAIPEAFATKTLEGTTKTLETRISELVAQSMHSLTIPVESELPELGIEAEPIDGNVDLSIFHKLIDERARTIAQQEAVKTFEKKMPRWKRLTMLTLGAIGTAGIIIYGIATHQDGRIITEAGQKFASAIANVTL